MTTTYGKAHPPQVAARVSLTLSDIRTLRRALIMLRAVSDDAEETDRAKDLDVDLEHAAFQLHGGIRP
jgi:hypothetical protein